MRILPPAPTRKSSPAGYSLKTRETRSGTYGLLHSGRHAAVMHAAADTSEKSTAALDDWSGSFDIHLGVYSSD